MQPNIGSRYQLMKEELNLCSIRKSMRGLLDSVELATVASEVARALNRIMSLSMHKKSKFKRFFLCANTLFMDVPLHSKLLNSSLGACTENDISDGAVGIRSSLNRAIKWG